MLSPAVFLFAAAATFSLFYLRTGSAEATTSRTGPLLDPRAASIQLRVDTQSSGLMLSWNRYSPAVQAANDGVLRIDDGSDHRELALDRNQILNGSVFYRPASQDVSFRLDLHGAHGLDVAQLLRVLDAQPRQVSTNMEPIQLPALQTRPNREITLAAQKPVEPQATGASSATDTAELARPSVPNGGAPLPDPPVVSQPLSDANPDPAALQPAASAPAVSSAPAPDASLSKSAAPLVPSSPPPAYVPPRPLKWVRVDEESLGVPKVAQGVDVKVKIKIDEAGNVTSAHALIDGPRRDKKLMAAAAAAVRGWKFEPAKAHGTNVSSEETIVLHLGPEPQ